MSGSTLVTRRADTFEIRLETPCISFAMRTDGTSPEQDFHRRAALRFEAELDEMWDAVPAILADAASTAGLALAPLGATSCEVHIGSGRIRVGLVQGATEAQRRMFQDAVNEALENRKLIVVPDPPPPPLPEPGWFERLRRRLPRW